MAMTQKQIVYRIRFKQQVPAAMQRLITKLKSAESLGIELTKEQQLALFALEQCVKSAGQDTGEDHAQD